MQVVYNADSDSQKTATEGQAEDVQMADGIPPPPSGPVPFLAGSGAPPMPDEPPNFGPPAACNLPDRMLQQGIAATPAYTASEPSSSPPTPLEATVNPSPFGNGAG